LIKLLQYTLFAKWPAQGKSTVPIVSARFRSLCSTRSRIEVRQQPRTRWTSLKTYSLLVLSAARKDKQELVHQDGTSMPGAAAPGKYPVNTMHRICRSTASRSPVLTRGGICVPPTVTYFRTAFPAQHLRPSGVLGCWPDGLELTPGFYRGSHEQHRLF